MDNQKTVIIIIVVLAVGLFLGAMSGQATRKIIGGGDSSSNCFDSDNGNNIYVTGYVDYNNTITYDYCSSTSWIFEYYCINNRRSGQWSTCPTGYFCNQGACRAGTTTTSSTTTGLTSITTTTTTVTTTTTIQANAFNFTAVEDAAVYEINPSANFGTSGYLEVRGISGSRGNSYIKFNVTGITKNIVNVTLFLTHVDNTQCSSISPKRCIKVFSVQPSSWSEYLVTWNNKPQFGSLLSSTGFVPSYARIRFDLTGTGYVNGNGHYSFGLNTTIANNTGILLYSKEGGVGSPLKPKLQIRQS